MLKGFFKKLSGDFVLSVSAAVIFNAVIQFVLYPYLTNKMGTESFGTVIYLLAVISVMGAFGSAANYSRMVVSTKKGCTNGDYNRFFAAVLGISAVVSAVALVSLKSFTPAAFAGYTVLMFATVLRYYGDVEYRLSCNFKGCFVFYILIAIGYLAGVATYGLTDSWQVTMLLGEVAALAYVGIKGKIFKPPFFEKSENYKGNKKSVWALTAANLVQTIILNADRILVMLLIGSVQVTVFYVAGLVGKITALVTVPLEGLVISYLNKYEDKLSLKLFAGFCGGIAALIALLTGGSVLGSYILVPFMYPEVYESARPLFLIANLGQVLFFSSTLIVTFVLKIAGEKIQMLLNLVYLAIFAAVIIPCAVFGGLEGLASGIAAVNLLRCLAASVYGIKKLKIKHPQA